ncbi:MAG: M23 family metallopeptidase [Smithellaceae bacterium]
MERVNRPLTVCHGRVFLKKGNVFLSLLFFLCICLLSMSCSGPQVKQTGATGVYHVVKKGETAYGIARAYAIPLQDLVDVNGLEDATLIREGAVLFIPDAVRMIEDVMVAGRVAGAQQSVPVGDRTRIVLGGSVNKHAAAEPRLSEPNVKSAPGMPGKVTPPPVIRKPAEPDSRLPSQGDKPFIWPVKGKVTKHFGIQPDKTYHNWIQIACPVDAEVTAAATGTVIFSSSLKDYGETVILRHAGGLATVYTHLKARRVKMDQTVKKGQVIALSGQAYIHFEVRRKGKALNPLFYLP